MVLNHINHKMPIYKDCTIGEVVIVAITSLIVLTIIFSMITILLFGVVWPGYLIASSLFFFLTKLVLSKLQKLKYGKPYGFYKHLLIKKLSATGIIRCNYVTRLGRWSVRRFIK
jgi:conjugative transfer region protein (TIGR03750 family)